MKMEINKKELEKHKEDFKNIVSKYGLSHEDKAYEIARFLTKAEGGVVSALEFSILFGMTESEAETFLSFIDKGLRFKEEHLDKK